MPTPNTSTQPKDSESTDAVQSFGDPPPPDVTTNCPAVNASPEQPNQAATCPVRAAIPLTSRPSPSGSATATKSRHSAYAASPTATKPSITRPKGCSPISCRAPGGSVVCPPTPIATPSARAPTTTYTSPLVAYPKRAKRSTHGHTSWAASFARCSASCSVSSPGVFGKLAPSRPKLKPSGDYAL